MHALDAIDRKILSLLQSDSRMTMQELSEKVGLSVSPCHRRVKLLEERGVITRYIATVDQKSLGLHVSVFISIKLARQKEEDLNRFARAISKWDEVLECYLMTGNRDYLLRVDDEVTCKTCGKRFEIPSQHSLMFVDQLEGLPKDDDLEAEIAAASGEPEPPVESKPKLPARFTRSSRGWRG